MSRHRFAKGIMCVSLVAGVGASYEAFHTGALSLDVPNKHFVLDLQKSSDLTRTTLDKFDSLKDPILNKYGKTNKPNLKPFAGKAAVLAAVASLESVSPSRCPKPNAAEQTFIIPIKDEEQDPTALLCFDTSHIVTPESGDGQPIVMTMIINKNYTKHPRATVPIMLQEYKPDQCKPIADRMTEFGKYLVEQTPNFPTGLTADVKVRGGDLPGPCDTYQPVQAP